MKYLFIVQGEGRGHLTQVLSLKEMLHRSGHEVTEILVGISNNRHLPHFFVEKAGVDITSFESVNFLPTAENRRSKVLRSAFYNIRRTISYLYMMHYLRQRIEASDADVVVNFYELLTGLTYAIYRPSKPYFCIGHQYLFIHKGYKAPAVDWYKLLMLKTFTRFTSLRCKRMLALSLYDMEGDNDKRITVVPPLLRHSVMNLQPQQGNYILGYMVNAGYAAEVNRFHKANPSIPMHFFWDKSGEAETKKIDDTLSFHQVNDSLFLNYMQGCAAYATTAGFESVCEAMLLGKPIMMVPAHVEQDCNAADAVRAGAGVVSDTFDLDKLKACMKTFKPNTAFPAWAHMAEAKIVPLLRP